MRLRLVFKMVLAVFTAAAALMCTVAQSPAWLVLLFIAAMAVVSLRAFGESASEARVDLLVTELRESHSGVDVAPLTSAFVSSSVVALPAERAKSRISQRFVLLFRDEVATVKWRSLATRLRMQRGRKRGS